MGQLYIDTFGDRLAWIHRNSQGMGLEKLSRYHQQELLKAIRRTESVLYCILMHRS